MLRPHRLDRFGQRGLLVFDVLCLVQHHQGKAHFGVLGDVLPQQVIAGDYGVRLLFHGLPQAF